MNNNNNNHNLQKLMKCYICEDTSDYCKNIFQHQSKHSQTLIYKFLEKFLGNLILKVENNCNIDENRNVVCEKCILKLDEYDLASVTAQRIENELIQLLSHKNGATNNFGIENLLVKGHFLDNFPQKIDIDNYDNGSNFVPIADQYENDHDVKINFTEENLQLSNTRNNKNKLFLISNQSKIQTVIDTKPKTPSKNCKSIIVKQIATSVNTKNKHKRANQKNVDKLIYKCSKCEYISQNKRDLKKHLKSHDDKQNVCDICGQTFKSESLLKSHHITIHCGLNPLECEMCGKNFSRRSHVVRHQLIHLKCSKCEHISENKSDLNMHLKVVHDIDDNKQYICDICGQTFNSRSLLKSHDNSIHLGLKPFECDICGKKFTQRVGVRRHMPLHSGMIQHQCDKCGKKFIHYASYRMHKLAHDNIRNQKCTVCGIDFRSTSHLTRHMRVHSGEKPYACPTCGQTFTERYNMTKHYKAHQGINRINAKTHACTICNASFTKPSKLMEHHSSEHNSCPLNSAMLSIYNFNKFT